MAKRVVLGRDLSLVWDPVRLRRCCGGRPATAGADLLRVEGALDIKWPPLVSAGATRTRGLASRTTATAGRVTRPRRLAVPATHPFAVISSKRGPVSKLTS